MLSRIGCSPGSDIPAPNVAWPALQDLLDHYRPQVDLDSDKHSFQVWVHADFVCNRDKQASILQPKVALSVYNVRAIEMRLSMVDCGITTNREMQIV